MEYRTIKEGATVYSGFAFKRTDLSPIGDYQIIKIGNLVGRTVDYSKTDYISKSLISDKHNKYFINNKDVLIAMTGQGSVGRVAQLRKKEQDTLLLNQRVGKFVCNETLDNDYLFYVLSSARYQELLFNLGYGSGQPNLSPETILNVSIPFPTLKTQQRIASILSTLEDKIAINTAINENLEQQAQALFKAWFVDFEPFGGAMPDDWRMGTLSEICGYSKDKVDIDNLTLDSYYSTENMQPNRQGAVQATTLPTIKQTTACKKGDVLISNIRPYFKKILYCFSDCGCSTDVLCFVPNKTDYSAFLYCALYADRFFDYMVAGSKGTKMPRGDKQQIMVYPICIPSAEYIKKFNQAVAPMLETVYTNRIEANNLANLRDTLLPKLMNGEIDVSAVQI